MNVHDLEARPRPHTQPSTVCVPGHGTAVTNHTPLSAAMARTLIHQLAQENR